MWEVGISLELMELMEWVAYLLSGLPLVALVAELMLIASELEWRSLKVCLFIYTTKKHTYGTGLLESMR